jgi:hypothetical protein
MNKQPPTTESLRLAVKDFVFTLPTVVALLCVAGLLGVPLGLAYRAGMGETLPHPAVDQRWTAGTGSVASMASWVVRGALPAPDPRQRRPPCDESVGEVELEGACWIWLGKPPPCPPGKAWERGGRCYMAVLKAEKLPRDPTSGEGRPLGVADP